MPRKRKNQKILKKRKRGGSPRGGGKPPNEKNSKQNENQDPAQSREGRGEGRGRSRGGGSGGGRKEASATFAAKKPSGYQPRSNQRSESAGSFTPPRRDRNEARPQNDQRGPSRQQNENAHSPRPLGTHRNDSAPVARGQAYLEPGRIVEGRIDIHPDGFGFLIASDPSLPNVYVGEENLKYSMHRDIVRVRIEGEAYGGNKYRGKIVETVRHSQKEFIGLYRPFSGGALAVPTEARDRKHAFKVTSSKIDGPIKSGATVLCRILTYPEAKSGTAEVESVMEDPTAASTDTLRVLIAAGWPREFSRQAISEAEERASRWNENFHPARRDVRKTPLVTIDGRDARDFDDAVYAKKEGTNIRLTVAIADVSHFVKPGTVLDREAYERATSVYFPDFVVPMLPEVLSNGVCSLNPNEDRACLVCEAVITPAGMVKEFEFYEGLMRSHYRLTYDLMQGFIEKEKYAIEELKALGPDLENLIEVFHRLQVARQKRGSIDLDLPEALVMLEKNGEVRDIQSRARLDSHRLIEECMLAANECAAKFIHEKLNEGVYRIHEEPDEKKINELVEFMKLTGVKLAKANKKGDYQIHLESPKDFNALLEEVREQYPPNDPTARAVQTLVLRTLKQAKYSTARVGHFALATSDYTHFTSPIRRYPDLIVHRLIKEALKVEKLTTAGSDLERQAMHCSDQERAAMECERKLIDYKKCRYMERHLGEEFEAWVNGITEKGLFCQVDGHFVEGLVSSETVYAKSKHRFDPQTLCYAGPGNSKIRLGSRIKIQVAAVTLETRRIDFDLLEILRTT